MSQDQTYVITALQSWGSAAASNAEHMAREISRTCRVLYVNPPLDMVTLLSGEHTPQSSRKQRVLRGSEKALRRINERLWVLEPPIIITLPTKVSSDMVFDLLNRRNNHRYSQTIEWAMQMLGIERFNLIIDNDIFRSFFLDEYLTPQLSIYYRRDNPLSLGYWRHHGRRLEPELVRRSDMVLTSSDPLAEQVRPYNYNTFNIGRGVNLTGFEQQREYALPTAMRNIPHPIIGFAGTLGVMFNSATLIQGVASCFANCSIVLVGDEDNVFARHALHSMPNVYFLEERHGVELAACISHFNVCISPQVRSDITQANYPDNIVQYLSLGKSVVSMQTDPVALFMGEIHIADDYTHFMGLVSLALEEHADDQLRERRAAFAAELSWYNCVERLYTLVDMIDSELHEASQYNEQTVTYS